MKKVINRLMSIEKKLVKIIDFYTSNLFNDNRPNAEMELLETAHDRIFELEEILSGITVIEQKDIDFKVKLAFKIAEDLEYFEIQMEFYEGIQND